MSLAAGTKIGPYEILALIGTGGMGEVYRARDANLRRDVALKILPPLFADDADRLARFRREAQVVASLNHPNIAGIHGFEDANAGQAAVHALILELVEGETLAEKLHAGGGHTGPSVAVDEVLHIARQIADALEAAHERGIIHRDLKPANIMITPDGRVKVLDFGLAKALDAAGDSKAGGAVGSDDSLTLARPGAMTEVGVVLGTAAYMSPEQTRGKPVDRRTDIWAFGCVLYEMLTGCGAFAGETTSDAIAAILEREPDWQALPPAARPLEPLLRRCLEKDIRRRLRDIGDVPLWLDDAATRLPAATPALPASSGRGRWIGAVVAIAIVAAGATIAVALRLRGSAALPVAARFELKPSGADPLSASLPGVNIAISPDGSRIVYTATRGGVPELILRRLDQLEASPIAGADGGFEPFFSPDGGQVGFATINAIKRIPTNGGQAVTICRSDPTFFGATWGSNDVVFFALDRGLFRVPASGGEPELFASPDATRGESSYRHPMVLPGGQAVLYTVVLPGGHTRIEARRVGGGERMTIVEEAFGPHYLPSGYLAYGQGDRVMAARFDVATLRLDAARVAVQKGVFTKLPEGALNVVSAADGTMVYVAGVNGGGSGRPVWVDRHGARLAAVVDQPLESPRNLRLSPDNRKLAITIGPEGQGQIWIYDLAGSAQPVKLTFQDHNTFPIWSRDGTKILFMSLAGSANGLSLIPADGSAVQPERFSALEAPGVPMDWSPDGVLLYLTRATNLWLLPPGGKVRRWLETPFEEFGGRFSPDGRWVAYASNQTGASEIWVRPFPGPGAPVRVSSGGGHDPVWSRDGRELFYQNGAQMLAARVVSTSPDFRIDAPQLLFEGGFVHEDVDLVIRLFDVAADGRLLVIEPADTGRAGIVVVQRWDQEIARLLSVR